MNNVFTRNFIPLLAGIVLIIVVLANTVFGAKTVVSPSPEPSVGPSPSVLVTEAPSTGPSMTPPIIIVTPAPSVAPSATPAPTAMPTMPKTDTNP